MNPEFRLSNNESEEIYEADDYFKKRQIKVKRFKMKVDPETFDISKLLENIRKQIS